MAKNILNRSVVASNDNVGKVKPMSFAVNIYHWIKISGIVSSLEQLDDRTLEDIGINRVNIRRFARDFVKNEGKTAA
ncbi:MAG: DUF1127 domain-containing protein [Alphaproteobacteria bacterium]|jgi:uncharacterized protein YjiS (DUF1127 family)|nr:DUF1127 domain-containing protein [Alphaproteobacteria bacterium]